jgi:two-component system nitrogen regulation sensor histidine kinase NtrY
MATLCVCDTGCGIPDKDKPRLFEPYFSTKQAGTGLGLAIVATIISDHGGYIRVKDQQPRGTEVIIELPLS